MGEIFGETQRFRARFEKSGSCARESYRLQKSTSGVRSITTTGEEPVTTVLGLAPSKAKASQGAKERRKPAHGGKAVRKVADSLLLQQFERVLVDGRRSGSGKPLFLTGGRWKRSWCFEGACHGFLWGATEGVRGRVKSSLRGRKSGGGGSTAKQERCSSHP